MRFNLFFTFCLAALTFEQQEVFGDVVIAEGNGKQIESGNVENSEGETMRRRLQPERLIKAKNERLQPYGGSNEKVETGKGAVKERSTVAKRTRSPKKEKDLPSAASRGEKTSADDGLSEQAKQELARQREARETRKQRQKENRYKK